MPEVTATADDLAEAIAEAEQAQAYFLQLEHDSLHAAPPDRPDIAVVTAAAAQSELSTRRVEVVRKRAEETREAERMAGLRAIGARVVQLAAAASSPSAEQAAEMRQIADLAASVRARRDAHDAVMTALYDEAAGLSRDPRHEPVKRTGQRGPWADHMQPQGLRVADTEVHVLGGSADQAIAAAVSGDVDGALKLLTPVSDYTPSPPAYYLRDTLEGPHGLGLIPVRGPLKPDYFEMLRTGRLVQMTPEEVSSWQQNR